MHASSSSESVYLKIIRVSSHRVSNFHPPPTKNSYPHAAVPAYRALILVKMKDDVHGAG